MRYLLFLLVGCTAAAQGFHPTDVAFGGNGGIQKAVIAFLPKGTNVTTSAGTSYATLNNYQIAANAMAVAIVVNSKASAPDTPTFAGNGLTWTQFATTNYNTDVQRLTLFYSTPSNNISASGAGTASFGGNSQTGGGVYVCEFSGIASSGYVVQGKQATNAIANASITLGALDASGRNAVIAAFGNVSGNGGGFSSPEAGWTEDLDDGYNTPATGLVVQHRLMTTDNTPSVTSSAAQWACIAIEIKVGTP